jgi:hypothetical protein
MTTPFVFMLAALFVALFRLSGRSDLAVGSPATAREIPETTGIAGFLANMSLFGVS